MARSTSGLIMSMGTVNMWGFSPAFDPCKHLYVDSKHAEDASKPEQQQSGKKEEKASSKPVSVLLIMPGDIRHALTAIARRRRWDPELRRRRELHIYILESSMEVLARHLMLLRVACDWSILLRQRCSLFLEIFGNAFVQERTSAYIEDQAKSLMDFVYNERGQLAGLVDLSHLKMRSRDDLIDVFRGWARNVAFNMQSLRDHRLRHYYEDRYDYRDNLIDWDYTMNLKRIENASVIHIRQYRDWRNKGIAFEFGDQAYTEPNRTMAAYTQAKKRNHGSVLCRGVWTDIVVSPYVSLGVNCDASNKFAEQLFEIHNKGTGVEQNRHNTTEVAVYNMLSYLHEIETGEVYKMTKAHDIYSGINTDDHKECKCDNQHEDPSRFEELDTVAEENEESTIEVSESDQKESPELRRERIIAESFEGVKVIPLIGRVEDLYGKKRYAGLFDSVFVSSQQAQVLQPIQDPDAPTFTSLLVNGANVNVESSLFLLPLKDDQRAAFVRKVMEWAPAMYLTPAFSFAKDGPSIEDMTKIKNATLHFQYAAK